MNQRAIRLHIGVIAGALAAALGACKKGSEYASTDTMKVDSAAGRADTGARAVSSPDSGTPAGKWADASVLGYTVVASRGEIALGKLGEKMATNPAVRSFALMLVTDHQKLLASTKGLATKLSTTADTSAGDANDLMNHDADEIKDLTGKPKGADWDKSFIDEAIEGHQKILSQLQDAGKNSPSATVRSSLEQASGIVQQHLTKAQDIKSKILKD
jgi:putative membrane protein